MGLKRGDVILVAPPGEFSKPRPALVIQANVARSTEIVTVALITSDLFRASEIRVSVKPNKQNGLRLESEVMVDNIQTFSIKKVGSAIGTLDAETMRSIDIALALHLGLD